MFAFGDIPELHISSREHWPPAEVYKLHEWNTITVVPSTQQLLYSEFYCHHSLSAWCVIISVITALITLKDRISPVILTIIVPWLAEQQSLHRKKQRKDQIKKLTCIAIIVIWNIVSQHFLLRAIIVFKLIVYLTTESVPNGGQRLLIRSSVSSQTPHVQPCTRPALLLGQDGPLSLG